MASLLDYNPDPNAFNIAQRPLTANPTQSPAPVSGSNFLSAFVPALLQHLAGQNANAAASTQLKSDVLLGRHLGLGGGTIGPGNPTGSLSGDPFTNGFFQPAAARLADMTNHTGAYAPNFPGVGVTPAVRAMSAPMSYELPPIDPDVIQARYGAPPASAFAGPTASPNTAAILASARLGAYARPQDRARVAASPNPFGL